MTADTLPTCDDGSRLQCFSEAHVVSKHSVEAAAAQERHPTDARPLVRAQLAPDLHRQRVVIHLSFAKYYRQRTARMSSTIAVSMKYATQGPFPTQ